ncbi:hypothetical protein CRG98_040655 [Punica granatum]|uniref:Uncharacterized protein n=1 Tax=Punica granatum TaxID=22663 RepID=A0A2I0I4R7_PUNGR|nr:hypothetical protein CRG98_040655 [Punica granatum]
MVEKFQLGRAPLAIDQIIWDSKIISGLSKILESISKSRYFELGCGNVTRLVSGVKSFSGFYGEEWPHRRLRWLHSLGSCEVIANFKSATVEMLVTTSWDVRAIHRRLESLIDREYLERDVNDSDLVEYIA